jgi:hypothetical protein
MVPSRAKPTASHADVLLHESRAMLTPLARMLVAHGVTYPQFAQAMKDVFLDAARAELRTAGKPTTDSALSLLSGVHRKDVRALAHADGPRPAGDARAQPSRALSLAAEVFTRWANDRRFADASGRPAALPLHGAGSARSFDGLVRSISKDFHPRSVLNELVRLGVAEVAGDEVHLKAEAFIPHEGFSEIAYYISANVRDHLAAAAANLQTAERQEKAPFLEHAVYADELSPQSAVQLQRLARRLWSGAVRRMVKAALAAVEADRLRPPAQRTMRMRFGAFYFSEPVDAAAAEPERSSRGRA